MSQENLQTMIIQNFWEVKEVYYGIVQVVNGKCVKMAGMVTDLKMMVLRYICS